MKVWVYFSLLAALVRSGDCLWKWFHHHDYHHDNNILTSLFGSHSESSHTSVDLFSGLFSTGAVSCDGIKEFADLKNIRTVDPCVSLTQIWTPLNNLREKNRDCFLRIVQLLAASPPSKRHCTCPGTFDKSWHSVVLIRDNNFGSCLLQSGCKELASFFYPWTSSVDQCTTHENVWHYLKAAGTDTDKLDFIVEHLAATYSQSNMSTCTCQEVFTTSTSSSTAPPTTRRVVTPTPPTAHRVITSTPSTTHRVITPTPPTRQPMVTPTPPTRRPPTTVVHQRTPSTVAALRSATPPRIHVKVSATTPLHQTP